MAPRALQLVVKHRVFERSQIQAGGVAHKTHANQVGKSVAKQAVAKGVGPAQDIAQNGQRQFDPDKLPDVRQIAGLMRDEADDGVDDELGNP